MKAVFAESFFFRSLSLHGVFFWAVIWLIEDACSATETAKDMTKYIWFGVK